MRDDNNGGGAILFILLMVAAICLAAHLVCNVEVDQPDVDPAPICTQTPERIEETPEEKLRRTANKILNCTVTYYCAETYEHICGDGDGLTATGMPVTPYVTCAVDPGMIPLGSAVWVDYSDGVLHEYIAQDVGGAVIGGHVDLAVTTHEEADACGRRTATVYWKEQ